MSRFGSARRQRSDTARGSLFSRGRLSEGLGTLSGQQQLGEGLGGWQRRDGDRLRLGLKPEGVKVNYAAVRNPKFEDEKGVISSHDNPVVITMILANANLYRMLVDQESSADILFKLTFNKLGLEEKDLKAYLDTLFRCRISLQRLDKSSNSELTYSSSVNSSPLHEIFHLERNNHRKRR
ncbi:hypothetical protein AHAS_Ahas13G0262600 [Arachis hypogaea]